MTTANAFSEWAAHLSPGDWVSLRDALLAGGRLSGLLATAVVLQPGLSSRIRADADDVERDASRFTNWLGVLICTLEEAIEGDPDYRPPAGNRP